jgi:hypothetical protein
VFQKTDIQYLDFIENIVSACKVSSYLVSGEATNECVMLMIFIWFLRLLLLSDEKIC